MMDLVKILRQLFLPRPIYRPDDLRLFDEARHRLHKSGRALTREIDAFGDMVREMRGDGPRPVHARKLNGKKPRAQKK